MQFCQDHWDRLREAIDARGLSHLISGDGEKVVRRLHDELERGKQTEANFDPLMTAHWSIVSNAMTVIQKSGGSPLYLMGGNDEEPVVGHPGYEDRTWPRCPLCYIGLAHELTCTGCAMPKVDGFAWMIDRAADDAAKAWERLREEAPK